MVAIRVLCVLAVLLGSVGSLVGCGQSLFDANGDRSGDDGGGDDDGGDGDVPVTCPAADCIADAAADWNGEQGGADGDWRYLDDRRNRMWKQMTPTPGGMDGEGGSQIRLCRDQSSNAACKALPGALLVSSTGTAPDPALEFTSATAQVIQLAFHARAESGAHRVHLYRNSREDLLVRAEATPGATASGQITVDALTGDRFLIALEPTASEGGVVALQFFVVDQRQKFPQTCELAIAFKEAVSLDSVADLCRDALLRYRRVEEVVPPLPADYSTFPVMPVLGGGPFAELDKGADVVAQSSAGGATGHYYQSSRVLTKENELTIQLWVRHDGLVTNYFNSGAWVFSDLDLDAFSGLGLQIHDILGRKLEISGFGDQDDLRTQTADYPTDGAWHFVRVAYTGGEASVCLDGTKVTGLTLPAGRLTSRFEPTLAKNGDWEPYGAYFDGGIDDVRVFSVALPCQ